MEDAFAQKITLRHGVSSNCSIILLTKSGEVSMSGLKDAPVKNVVCVANLLFYDPEKKAHAIYPRFNEICKILSLELEVTNILWCDEITFETKKESIELLDWLEELGRECYYFYDECQ